MHTDIQLLPQQAGMASILATAVINSKYVTPRGRLWLTLKSKVRADPGGGVVSMQKVQFTHTGRGGQGINYAPVRH